MEKGRKAEKTLAKQINGRRVPMSGGGYTKGDVHTDRFCIQSKATDNKSFSVKLSDLQKAERDAMSQSKEPLFCIDICGQRFWLLWDYQIGEILDEEQRETGIMEEPVIEEINNA